MDMVYIIIGIVTVVWFGFTWWLYTKLRKAVLDSYVEVLTKAKHLVNVVPKNLPEIIKSLQDARLYAMTGMASAIKIYIVDNNIYYIEQYKKDDAVKDRLFEIAKALSNSMIRITSMEITATSVVLKVLFGEIVVDIKTLDVIATGKGLTGVKL